MKIIFYHILNEGEMIQKALDQYLSRSGIEKSFSVVESEDGNEIAIDDIGEKYLFFYSMSAPEDSENLKLLIRQKRLNARIVALCRDFQDGISAVSNGSDYALKVPLNYTCILRCMEYLEKLEKNRR